MIALLERLHRRLGDFWWYSLMIFMAARAADCLNVFVGLWLVPKYVPPSELGAVMPLTNFAGFLAIPIGVFASTFRQELSNLAVNREFGKLKTLMRGVFIATAVFFFVALVISHFALPHYLTRIRVAEGSLGMLIIAYSFINAMSPIFSNPLQALKKFKATTVISLVGAPVRFLTMLATIPLRALSGYFVGQASVPSFSIVTSVIALRQELSVKAERYWTLSVVRRFSKLFLIFGVGALAGGFAVLVETTVLRQRLPEVESAAYYMMTRFSDIASFAGTTLVFTIFPFAAELGARGKNAHALVCKSFAAVIGVNLALALVLAFCGAPLLRILPFGESYAEYAWGIPWMIAIVTVNTLPNLHIAAESAAMRFGYMRWWVPLHILYGLLLLAVTGYGYFANWLPAGLNAFLSAHNVTTLSALFMWMSVFALVKSVFCVFGLISPSPRSSAASGNATACSRSDAT